MKAVKSLILGCARFSGAYGVGNTSEISKKNVHELLNKNRKFIKGIDTAIAYKKANNKLKNLNLRKFKVSTKVPYINVNVKNFEKKILNTISKQIQLLDIKSFDVIYLHSPSQLITKDHKYVLSVLKKFKKLNFTSKIGVSIYNPSDLKKILKVFIPDVVQFPLNILDRRFLDKKIIKLIKKNNIIPYARSIFLQGLLLKDITKLPKYFFKWKNLFLDYEKWINDNKISKLEGCLSILNSSPIKINLILGVENNSQFKKVYKKINTKISAPKKLYSKDRKLLNPYLWKI